MLASVHVEAAFKELTNIGCHNDRADHAGAQMAMLTCRNEIVCHDKELRDMLSALDEDRIVKEQAEAGVVRCVGCFHKYQRSKAEWKCVMC